MEIFNFLTQGDSLFLLIKLFFLTASFLFTAFLFVVFKQVLSLNGLVTDENDSIVLKTFSFVLLIFSISLFLTALVIL